LSAHKKIIYDAFVQSLGAETEVDFFVYHNHFKQFQELIARSLDRYTHYVIITHFQEGGESAYQVLNQIPPEKLLLLDRKVDGVRGNYGAVYQNFEKDIYQALSLASSQLRKYHTLKLVFPYASYHAKEIAWGFERYCRHQRFHHQIIHHIPDYLLPREAYVILQEHDLVALAKLLKKYNYTAGQEVGIISYNETPLKEVLLDGITVISTDFEKMGRCAAEMILRCQGREMENDFRLILRQSL
ncbi:MAG: substrate-binding domain-containing protein, partial [Bacteroidia bacterium]|nr:substrate-binding domain-containing protein [Bacteroidia bacterium]